MYLRSLHVTALSFSFSHLVHALCLSYSCSKTPNFLKMMDFFRHHFSSVCRGFFWPPRRWMYAYSFTTLPIISFIQRANSAFSTAFFAFHFRPVITEGWAFSTSGSRELRRIWKSCNFPNLYSSTSDNVGSFSFADELYSATFVKELDSHNHFLNRFTD